MLVAVDGQLELFGIGDTLREARLRRGLELADVERDTCIRAYNLRLIEDERFDALPGDVYALGFIRTYAEYLGLDSDRYVDAFRAARETDPEPIVHEAIGAGERSRRGPLLLALLAVCAGIAGGLVFLLRHDSAPTKPAAPAAPKTAPAVKTTTAAPILGGPLVLRATGGDSWVVVRFGDSKGKLVWQGTLRRRQQLRLGLDKPLFVGLGRPEAVFTRIGAKRIRLAPSHSLFVFSRAGVRAVRG